MLRVLLATLAGLLLVGVLALLIVESRAVKEEYYVAHAERVRAIETTKNDLATIDQGTRAAFKEGRPVSASMELAFARIGENNLLLQGAYDDTDPESALSLQLVDYSGALERFVASGQAFLARQNALAEALRRLQEESPIVVKDLRRFNLRIQSQNAFSLAIDVIEFATGQSAADVTQIANRIAALRTDAAVESRAPGRLDNFVEAAGAVIAERTAAEAALEKLGRSRISDQLWALSDAIHYENRRTVDRAERAKLLLAVCAILLLAGTGYVVFRLQSSYQALNRSNAELADINNTLEERVSSRTEQLSEAYDELKESQVQLVQAEKMSSLGELVAGISHEINTPLWYLINNSTVVQERLEAVSELCNLADSMITAVSAQQSVKEAVSRGLVGMNKLLKEGLKDDVEECKDLTRDSIEGLEELTELAQSLKDFSRLDRAKQGKFNINDGADKALLIAKNKLKNKVTVHKHYGDIPEIHCSPSQINQIFLNLITNAADAITEQGEILIRTWSEDNTVCFSVADTGCGIEEDVLSKIRDPFFTTKEVGRGTGLGLSIVDRIVETHGGELKIESEVGRGTSITIMLPVTASAENPEMPEELAAANEPVAALAPEEEPGLPVEQDEPVPGLAAV